jgi:hypothetical protein
VLGLTGGIAKAFNPADRLGGGVLDNLPMLLYEAVAAGG